MKSRIRTHKKRTREQTQEFSTAPAQGMFQSRPFVVQTQQAEQSQQPDLKTSLMRAERYGHHLGRKKKIENSENKAVQLAPKTKNNKKPAMIETSQPQEAEEEAEAPVTLKQVAEELGREKEELEEALKLGDYTVEEIWEQREAYGEELNEWKKDWGERIEGDARKSAGQTEAGLGGSSDWMTSHMGTEVKRKKEERGGEFEKGAGHTMHHKISRAQIGRLVSKYQGLKEKGIASEFQKFVNQIGEKVKATSMERILINMPANLELGPSTDKRVGDPGSGFDPNVEQSGRRTPRSAELNEASRVMEGDMTTKEEWTKLTKFLREAHEKHEEEFKGELVSEPRDNQWSKEGGKYRKIGT